MATLIVDEIQTKKELIRQDTLQEVCDRLRERSISVDQSGRFSRMNWELLRNAGLLGLVVPEEFGGLGAGPSHWLKVVREMGQACPSTTLCYLMHLCATSVVNTMASSTLKKRYLPRIAAGEVTVAYAGTEKATGTNFWCLESSAEKVNGAWRLSLKKDWATLAEVADLFVVPTRAQPGAAPDQISLFLVERSSGVKSWEAWQGTGMRGSSSGPVSVNAIVSDEHLMGEAGKANDYITTDMFNLLLLSHAGLYLGVSKEAFALAVQHAKSRRFSYTDCSLAETSIWQSNLGELSAELAACWALIETTAQVVETANRTRRLLKNALSSKLIACSLARRATDLGLQITGGRGYNIGQRVEMLWRDARAGSLMRPSDEVTKILLGKLETGQSIFD